MPGKNKIQHFSSLHQKKYRLLHQQFIAEGHKIVLEIIRQAYPCTHILASSSWFEANKKLVQNTGAALITCTVQEIKKISNLEAPQEVIAVCTIPEQQQIVPLKDELSLYLDKISDPGNLGTLIRLADWFGIRQVFACEQTVDWTNPKVIQASMGAFTRVQVNRVVAPTFFEQVPRGTLVMAADLQGESIYQPGNAMQGILIIGSEAHGISTEIRPYVNTYMHIPRYPADSQAGESLNAAVAAALIIGELRRRLGLA